MLATLPFTIDVARRCFVKLFGALVVLGACLSPAAQDESRQSVEAAWTCNLECSIPSGMALVDVNIDGVPEIIVTDIAGMVSAIHADTGAILWQSQVSGSGLTPPLPGSYVADGVVDIVVGDYLGSVFLIAGGTGQVLAECPTGERILPLSPTLVPLPVTDPPPADAAVVLSDSGTAMMIAFGGDPIAGTVLWSNRDFDRLEFPLIVANVIRPDVASLVAASTLSEIRLLSPSQGNSLPIGRSRADSYVTEGRRPIRRPLAVGDMDGDGLADLAYADKASGDEHVLVLTSKGSGLKELWPESAQTLAVENLLMADFRPGGGRELLVVEEDSFDIFDAAGQRLLSEVVVEGFGSDIALLEAAEADRPTHLIYFDKAGLLRIKAIHAGKTGALELTQVFAAKPPFSVAQGGLLVGDGDGDFCADVYGVVNESGRQSEIYCIATELRFPSTALGWVGERGHPFRSGRLDPLYYSRLAEQQMSIDRLVAKTLSEAQARYVANDWDGATTGALMVLAWNPEHSEAKSLLTSAKIGRHFVKIVVAVLLAVAFIGLLVLTVGKNLWRNRLRRQAEAREEEEDYDGAIDLYMRLRRLHPRNAEVRDRLAELLISQEVYPAESIDVFEAAAAANPDDEYLTHGLARAYMENRRTHERAMETYNRVRRTFTSRDEIEAFLGVAYANRGETGEAMARLEDAVRHGCVEIKPLQTLGRLYLESGSVPADVSPAFETASQNSPGDVELLETACLAHIAARRADEEAMTAYHRLLEFRPRHAAVLAQLSYIALSRGEKQVAYEFAQRVLEQDSESARGLALMGHALVALARQDEEAVSLLERAIAANPDERVLVRALAHAYLTLDRHDDEAVAVFKRARQDNPDDASLNAAVADAAEKEGDRALLITALEQLVVLGRRSEDIMLRLGLSYREEGVVDTKAIEPYQQALEAMPGDEKTRRLLGEIYVREDRMDGGVIAILEPLAEGDDPPLELALHLARALQVADRHEDSLKLLERLLADHPGAPEIARLHAEASLRSNRLENAIEEYQRLLAQNPNDAEALANCAIATSDLQRMDPRSVNLYQRALALNPDHPGVLRVIARVHAAKGAATEAIKDLKRVLEIDPKQRPIVLRDCHAFIEAHDDVPEMRWFYAQILVADGRFQQAVEQLKRIYELAPSSADGLIRLYEQILSKDRENIHAHLGVALLHHDKGDFFASRSSLEQAYNLAPDNADVIGELTALYEAILAKSDDMEARFRLAGVYRRVGRHDDAIACLQRCAQDYRWEQQATFSLAETFVDKGMLDIAFNELRKLPIEGDAKELLYDLAGRFEDKGDLVGAKNAFRLLVSTDISYRDVRNRFDALAGSTSDPMVLEKTAIVNDLSDVARRRYELLEELGRGAMGIVYRAKDHELDEEVALKILPDNLSNNLDAISRFKSEARSARRLSHPNIVRIHDIGEEMGRKYISMEFVDGMDLKAYKKEQNLPVTEILSMGASIASALTYAHEMGIVHRDIKPANIMVGSDGAVKITDFGIAKAMQSNDATMAGAVLGTPLYMSPEQVRGAEIDNRADLYSLGVLLYELVAGEPPFANDNLAYQHLHADPPPIENAPPVVAEIIMKCLEKERDDRYATGDELSAALTSAADALANA